MRLIAARGTALCDVRPTTPGPESLGFDIRDEVVVRSRVYFGLWRLLDTICAIFCLPVAFLSRFVGIVAPWGGQLTTVPYSRMNPGYSKANTRLMSSRNNNQSPAGAPGDKVR